MEVRVTLLEMKRKLNQNEGNNIIENTLNNKYTFFLKKDFYVVISIRTVSPNFMKVMMYTY